MGTPVLWQFKCSHFSEKVRWALDHKRIPHRRRSLNPGWHALPTLLVSGGLQVPLLRTGGKTLRDSTRILEHLEQAHPDPPLVPDDPDERRRAWELEELFDGLGSPLRRVHYSLLVPHLDEAAAFFSNASRGPTYRLYRATWGRVFRPRMGRYLGFEPERLAESRRRVDALLARFEREVRPSGYLAGDAFGVADLTLASLLSTLIFPDGFPYPLAMPFPAEVLAYRDSLERYAALDWARGIYAEHRPPSAEIAR